MPFVRAVPFAPHRLVAGLISIGVLALAMDHALAVPSMEGVEGTPTAPAVSGHLVVSEVMTGGAGASDEFIELYNPTAATLPLEGLEVVYVTATGATVTRKASWAAGAPGVPAGAHLLVANGAGIFAGIANVSYANGLAATGGSVALREIGAATAIDAVGWGTAANTWLETQPAPAPAAGSSLERLPGGSSGSGQDTDDNLVDFAVQPVPDPQNAGSALIPGPSPSPEETASAVPTASPAPTASTTPEPTATPSTTQTPSISPSPTPTLAPTATPTPTPMTIAEARSEPDGATVTVEGVSLTVGDFTDGGGYLVDASAGIAVLVVDGTFARGQRMRVSGTVDDRYAQRTIRATAATIVSLGTGSEPLPLDAVTGSVDEALEGRLVEVSGLISSGVTTLSTGLAWDVDDGSGASRILVGTATGIDTSSWARGVGLTVVGVVGQRDSTGTGVSGFRIQPRDPSDIQSVEPVATPSPSPTPQPTATPAPSVTPSPTAITSASLVSISEARAATTGTRLRVRGVVTAASGLIEVGSAVVQDASGAILVRLGTDVGILSMGQLVELDGTRATKAGMLTLRVSIVPQYLGTQADPEGLRRTSGAAGEAEEARVVIVRGAISSAISRARAGNVSFAVDDGSGPLRVTISPRAGISTGSLTRGAWLELRGVLSQETTGSAPSSGYRLWPRIPADLRVLATSVAGSSETSTCCLASAPPHAGSPGTPSGANKDQAVAQAVGRAPSLARPQATGSPRPLPTTGSAVAATRNVAAPAGGLVVSGMGLAALAGLAAWFGRRRGPEDDQPAGEEPGDAPDAPETAAPHGLPRLSVLRSEAADARKERGILPPT